MEIGKAGRCFGFDRLGMMARHRELMVIVKRCSLSLLAAREEGGNKKGRWGKKKKRWLCFSRLGKKRELKLNLFGANTLPFTISVVNLCFLKCEKKKTLGETPKTKKT